MGIIKIEPTGAFSGINLFDDRAFPKAITLKDGRKVDPASEITIFIVGNFAGVMHFAKGLVVESDDRPTVFGVQGVSKFGAGAVKENSLDQIETGGIRCIKPFDLKIAIR